MNSRYEQFEDELVNQFFEIQNLPGIGDTLVKKSDVFFDISALPDLESQFSNTSNPKAYVICNNADYTETENLSVISQEEKIQIGFQLIGKKRRGETGIFAMAKIIQKYILGYKSQGCDKMQLVAFSPLEGNSPDNWQYFMMFSTVTHVTQFYTEITDPKFKTATIK